MRKRIKGLVFLWLVLIGCMVYAQTSPLTGSLIIKGEIKGLSKGTAHITTEVFGEKQTFDAPIVQGKFQAKINQPSPTLYSLTIQENPDGRFLFFADNGTVQIEGTQGNLDKAKLTGSISNIEFGEYNTMVSNYDFLLNTIRQVWADLEQKGELEKNGELLPRADSLQRAFSKTTMQRDSSIATWITKHNKSFVSPLVMILNYGNDGDPISMRRMFEGFSADVKKSYYANFLDGIIVRKEGLSLGKDAPLFSQADPSGKPISLKSFRGKYVLIDFWASWCGPCRQENPNVVKTYQKFKDRNFEVLGVSLDNNKAKWLKAIEEDNLDWTQVSDLKYWRNEVAVQYGVQSIPANFLLDKDGKIIAKGLRGPALAQTLERLLATESLGR